MARLDFFVLSSPPSAFVCFCVKALTDNYNTILCVQLERQISKAGSFLNKQCIGYNVIFELFAEKLLVALKLAGAIKRRGISIEFGVTFTIMYLTC